MEKSLEEYELKRKISTAYCISKKINENYDIRTIGDVYLYIAKKYETPVSCIEKSMRYAKEKSKYKEYWKLTDNLKNQDFLQMCIDKIIVTLFHK